MPDTTTITAARKIRDALSEWLDAIEQEAPAAARAAREPKWKTDYRRWWLLLTDVADAGGDLSTNQWKAIGARHGYHPSGLGGFFRGAEPVMARQGERRVLTQAGRDFLRRHHDDFADEVTA